MMVLNIPIYFLTYWFPLLPRTCFEMPVCVSALLDMVSVTQSVITRYKVSPFHAGPLLLPHLLLSPPVPDPPFW